MKNLYLKAVFVSVVMLHLLSSCSDPEHKSDDKKITRFFNAGDRVVFVGNSITHGGMFHNNIYLFHVTRFPGRPLEMFNKGVSGDVAGGVLSRMYDDILSEKPTVAVIMLGMNDVNRGLYGPQPTSDKDTLQMRKAEVNQYKTRLDSIVRIFLSNNVRVILERPSIYDQTAQLSATNHLGVNDVLGECAVYIDSLGKKYDLPVVDYYTIMNRINLEIQKKDPSATLTGADRIHPWETGHFVMAYQFLKTEQVPRYVSKIIVDAGKPEISGESENCEAGKVRRKDNLLVFSVKEDALPFPVKAEQQEALKLVPFMTEMNVELLKVTGLSPGKYNLKIDNSDIGTFTAVQLNKGLNLAEHPNTPQMQQAENVRKKLDELWKMEGRLRGMKFIEYMNAYKECPDKNDLKTVEHYLDSIFSGYPDPYYKDQLKLYLENKPKEKKLIKRTEQIRKEVYALAKTKKHIYTLQLK
ncbi:MAG: SGNH/GDSL hydrolase family protein [Chlorobi bacterium]|nr:SGNH/GDSL hydrolase family protein [Chlorobiota bacterium]